MIRIFSKFRKKILTENRVSKYLLYALGEIVLVVLGILIALSINNWNEEEKIGNEIYAALEEVREDLVMDTLHLQQMIEIRQNDLASQGRVIKVLSDREPFTEQTYNDLGRVMLQRPTTLLTNGYDLVRELGMSHLNNRELRTSLVEYYETAQSLIQKELIDDTMEFEVAWLPYVRQHFSEWDFGERAIPHDDQQIANDAYFLMTLKMNHNNLSATLTAHQNALRIARDLIGMIDGIKGSKEEGS